MNMRLSRRALPGDLGSLLKLYRHLNPNTPELSDDRAREIWADLLSRQGVDVFVRVFDSTIVATCTLVTVPNLMRGGRSHALIENVVTHRGFRRQGHGRTCVAAALDAAWSQGCHHVMLLTGRKDPVVLRFYESCGFRAGVKAGLVALPPDGA
jgi:GNAT superfamily N-acetyltransferase